LYCMKKITKKSISIRYSEASCDTLVPTPTEENYAGFNLGPTTEVNDILSENEDSAFDSPKELTSRNPQFDILLSFTRYRSGKEYKSKLHRGIGPALLGNVHK
jgi:hypothetical protein